MSGEPTITLTGNATADAEVKFTNGGDAVASFTVAVTSREKKGTEWVDGATSFYRISAWKSLGENAGESIRKGDRVTVVGRLKPREYEHNGVTRTSLDVTADTVGLDLMWTPARFGERAQRSGGGQAQAKAEDPWGTPAGSNGEPPF